MTINSKSTKAEILAAYKALEKEKKALEIGKPKNQVVQRNNYHNKPVELKDIAKTITILEQLQFGFGGAVSHLSEQLVNEASTLVEIRTLITEEQTQLTELHNLKNIKEDTIDNLIEQYLQNHKQYSAELSQQTESKHQIIAELIKTWQKEKELHNREVKLRNEERRKNQKRAIEEYQYNLDLARDLEEEEHKQLQKQKYQELELVRQELEQQWQEKEQTIVQQEQEYSQAKEQVAHLEEKLRKKVKQGEEEGKAIGIYQAKIKHNLRVKEIEGQKHNYQLKIQALEQTIDNQETRISKLTQQLDLAQKQVQDLAVKAIEGTANRQSYEAIKEIALEQAKTQQKGK